MLNIFMFIHAFLLWLMTTPGFNPVFVTMQLPAFLVYVALFMLVRILVSIASEQSATGNLLYCIPKQFTLGLFINTALIRIYSGMVEWKGRKVK